MTTDDLKVQLSDLFPLTFTDLGYDQFFNELRYSSTGQTIHGCLVFLFNCMLYQLVIGAVKSGMMGNCSNFTAASLAAESELIWLSAKSKLFLIGTSEHALEGYPFRFFPTP